MAGALLLDDPQLVLEARVAERRAHEEAVELRLGKRERALELDRVLGRQQQERLRHRPGVAVDGDLPLRHRLEQRRLRLRHRAVDLVDEDDVGEDRAGAELEVPLALVEDREAGDVGRLQVGRALDARRLDAVDRLRDRARENRLRGAGDVFEQDVASAQERRQDELDPVALAVHDRLDVVEEPLRERDRPRERIVVSCPKRLGLHVSLSHVRALQVHTRYPAVRRAARLIVDRITRAQHSNEQRRNRSEGTPGGPEPLGRTARPGRPRRQGRPLRRHRPARDPGRARRPRGEPGQGRRAAHDRRAAVRQGPAGAAGARARGLRPLATRAGDPRPRPRGREPEGPREARHRARAGRLVRRALRPDGVGARRQREQ